MPFNLYPKQKKAINDCVGRINILQGSVRSGKTHASYEWWTRFLLHNAPDGDLLMTGKTLKSLERNVIMPMQGYIPINYSLHHKRAKMLGKTVHLEGANDKQSEGKIRGMTIAGHLGDEITLWPESYFNMGLSRMSVKGAKFIGTTNPDSPNHWLKTDWIDADKDVISRKLTIDDNPHLPEEFISSLKKEYTGLWYKRFIDGSWVMAEGAIYDMFNSDRHVIPHSEIDHSNLVKYYVGVDYGTSNATVFLLIGQHKNGNFYVVDEYRHSGRTGMSKSDQDYARDFKEWLGARTVNGVYVDPSAKSFMIALKQAGIGRILKANNSVLDGIRNVGSLLGNDLLYFSDRCQHCINGMTSYYWDSKAQQRGEDKPLKEADHEADAIRYVLHSTFPKWKGILQKKSNNVDRLKGARI